MIAALTPEAIESAFDVVHGEHDGLTHATHYDDDFDRDTRQIISALCRATFRCGQHDDVVSLVVYQNNTFRIKHAACGMRLASLAAHARAHYFVTRLGLEDAR